MAKEHLIVTRVDADMHEKIKQLAADERRTMSQYVRLKLEEILKHARPKTRVRS